MANPLLRVIVFGVLLVVATFLVSQGITVARFEYAIAAACVLAVFMFVFIKTEAGLYLVLFSMLLSPEFALGGGGLAERRTIVVRLEDLLLIAIALSWFAATAVMVSLIGAAQIPSGQRVSAPFEGEAGEPNTFGGYLLLMMAIAGGIGLETNRLKLRAWAAGVIGLMAVPFVFTLSRASYLALLPSIGMLALLSSRRKLMVGTLVLAVLVSPIVLTTAVPEPVKKRILYTFQPERGQATVRLGQLAFDPSTSERLLSMREAVAAWTKRPLFGYGVTAARRLEDPEDRGLAIGFVAATIGLLVHSIGSNSFIIIRIMEPFWFFAGIVAILPTLPKDAEAPLPGPVRAF